FDGQAGAHPAETYGTVNLVIALLIAPLTFFGGVFYNVAMLAEPWHTLSRFNPLLYLVDGLRFGLIGGTAAQSPWPGLAVSTAVCLVAFSAAWWILASGYK